ncbi:MAG: class I SAM-dependent methyltransferase [Oscillospiraceae bacterium]|nr:class I SAM-dependent methyltransferase [Oscillospiraceae bacterium]
MEYDSFSDFYDELMKEVGLDYLDLAKYYDGLIHKFGAFAESGISKDAILLDLGCGTGSLSLELAKLGWDVIGIDSSSQMLSKAIIKSTNQRTTFIQQDMCELDLFGTIDAAICALDGLNHLQNLDEIRTVLQKVALFMNAGGIFVFDINTLYKHEVTLDGHTLVIENDNIYCVWQNFYCGDGEIDIVLDIFSTQNTKEGYTRHNSTQNNAADYTQHNSTKNTKEGYTRHNIEITEKAYDLNIIENLCKQTGFEICACYDFMTHTPGNETNEKVVFICKRTNRV